MSSSFCFNLKLYRSTLTMFIPRDSREQFSLSVVSEIYRSLGKEMVPPLSRGIDR